MPAETSSPLSPASHPGEWPREVHAAWNGGNEAEDHANRAPSAPATEAAAEHRERELRRRLRALTPPEIPGHKMLCIIGRGAYGEVWLARAETNTFHAVKVVWREDFNHPELYHQEYAGTCLYEPLSRHNYGLVPILQVGHHEQDYFFCVMELADATDPHAATTPEEYHPRTLHSVMSRHRRRPIPLDQVIGAGLHLAHGLARLHEAGLTHGDIKPSNIVYIQEQPRLADAGMVARPGQNHHSGTVGYIPPEGAGSKQADVYALAMVLYEMATGRDRHDFPSLPTTLPEGNERWLAFNRIICAAADPSPRRRGITTAMQLGHRLEALRHPPVFRPHRSIGTGVASEWLPHFPPRFLYLTATLLLLLFLAATFLLPEGFPERLFQAWRVLMGQQPL